MLSWDPSPGSFTIIHTQQHRMTGRIHPFNNANCRQWQHLGNQHITFNSLGFPTVNSRGVLESLVRKKPEKYILIITHLVKKVKRQFDNKVETQFQEYIQNTILGGKKSIFTIKNKVNGWMILILSIWMRCETFRGNPFKCSNAKIIEGDNTMMIHRVKY